MNPRPRLTIRKDSNDYIIEVLGVLALGLLIGIPIYYFDQLPDMIPTHFGLNGEADAFGNKDKIWILPVIGIIMYVGMAVLTKFPHLFNYPQEINDQNAYRLYTLAAKMIRLLNTIITGLFAYISYASIKTAMNLKEGLGNYFILIFLVLMSGTTIFYLMAMIKTKKTTKG